MSKWSALSSLPCAGDVKTPSVNDPPPSDVLFGVGLETKADRLFAGLIIDTADVAVFADISVENEPSDNCRSPADEFTGFDDGSVRFPICDTREEMDEKSSPLFVAQRGSEL